MKTNSYLIILIIGLLAWLSSCDKSTVSPTPTNCDPSSVETVPIFDFSTCNCTVADTVVCGADGRTYTSTCLAQCAGTTVASQGFCDSTTYNPCDPMTWEIQRVCIPIVRPQDPVFIRDFGDGTGLYKDSLGVYFRGNINMCICLHPETAIATETGEIPVDQLKEGTLVWTLDECGEKELQPILFVNHVNVPKTHTLLSILLEDGRNLRVSPIHPDKNDIPLHYLKKGSELDGSIVKEIKMIPANIEATWDILPAGETATYFANGIAIGSTLKTWSKEILP